MTTTVHTPDPPRRAIAGQITGDAATVIRYNFTAVHSIFEIEHLVREANRDKNNLGAFFSALGVLRILCRTGFLPTQLPEFKGIFEQLRHPSYAAQLTDTPGTVALIEEQLGELAPSTLAADFGTIATFIDIASDLVMDDDIYAFLSVLAGGAADNLLRIVRLRDHRTMAILMAENGHMSAEASGMFRLLDISADIYHLIAGLNDVQLKSVVAEFFYPWYRKHGDLLPRFYAELMDFAENAEDSDYTDTETLVALSDVRDKVLIVHQLAADATPNIASTEQYGNNVITDELLLNDKELNDEESVEEARQFEQGV